MQLFNRAKVIIVSSMAVVACTAATTASSPAGAGEAAGSATPLAVQTCDSHQPCVSYRNRDRGPGIQSISNGTALIGITEARGHASPPAAVLGLDRSGYATGVRGFSKNGTGLSGEIFGDGTGAGIGVLGQSGTGYGVVGSTYEGYGVEGTSNGVGIGVVGRTSDSEASAIVGISTVGNAIFANAPGFTALEAAGGGRAPQGYVIPALLVYLNGQGPTDLIEAYAGPTDVMSLDDSGNLHITGLLYTAGSCSSGCAVAGKTVRRVVSYAPSESQRSMEDFGKGQIVNGQGNVRLDPAFANVIDRQSDYLVFITPEGDSRGLYVTDKTPNGFSVRENQGGRSTLAFDYRIVAKPFDDASKRLPMVELPRKPAPPKFDARIRSPHSRG